MRPHVFTHNDLIDAILREFERAQSSRRAATLSPPPKPQLPAAPGGPRPFGPTPGTAGSGTVPAVPDWKFALEAGPKGRRFYTEADIKKALTPSARHLTIPRDAIVSPLALDWLALKGIQIVRE